MVKNNFGKDFVSELIGRAAKDGTHDFDLTNIIVSYGKTIFDWTLGRAIRIGRRKGLLAGIGVALKPKGLFAGKEKTDPLEASSPKTGFENVGVIHADFDQSVNVKSVKGDNASASIVETDDSTQNMDSINEG